MEHAAVFFVPGDYVMIVEIPKLTQNKGAVFKGLRGGDDTTALERFSLRLGAGICRSSDSGAFIYFCDHPKMLEKG